jgi:hypothetical protein
LALTGSLFGFLGPGDDESMAFAETQLFSMLEQEQSNG